MAHWSASFTHEANDDLSKLDNRVRERIFEKIRWLLNSFDEVNHLPLGYKWQGFFKLRIGDWRIIYEINYSKNKITVHYINHRDKIYKRKR